MPSNAAFHPTIETVGFQTAFSVKPFLLFPVTQFFKRPNVIGNVKLKRETASGTLARNGNFGPFFQPDLPAFISNQPGSS
jgi:hypothetical protein